jgi:CheY-like chemotaxis protein
MQDEITLPESYNPARNGWKPVLYVEDEENDVLLCRLGLKRAGIHQPLQIVFDGMQAIQYLAGTGEFSNRDEFPFPCLMLLDLNLPRVSGAEVLAWARKQPQCADLPIVIFTSSDQHSDRERTRELGADDYLLKPSGLHELVRTLQKLKTRWLDKHCAPDAHSATR